MNTSNVSCPSCNDGTLMPLSDEGRGGGSMPFKAWVCCRIECDYVLRIDAGKVSKTDEPLEDD